MNDPRRKVTLLSPARRFYEDEATPDEQRLLDAIFDDLAQDPTADDETKFSVMYAPTILTAYVNGEFKVIYYIEREVLKVWTIGRRES